MSLAALLVSVRDTIRTDLKTRAPAADRWTDEEILVMPDGRPPPSDRDWETS